MLRYIKSSDFNFSAMLSYSLTIFQKQFPLIMLLVIITQAAINIPMAVWELEAGIEIPPDNLDWVVSNIWWFIAFAIGSSLLFLLLQLTVIKVAVATAREEAIELGDAFRSGFVNLVPAILLGLLVVLIIGLLLGVPMVLLFFFAGPFAFLALPLLILPVLIVSVYLAFSLQALAVRGMGVIDALGHSWELVSGRWWRVFGYILGMGIILGVVSYVVQLVLQQIPFAGDLLALFAADALNAFTIIAMTLFFLHLDYEEASD